MDLRQLSSVRDDGMLLYPVKSVERSQVCADRVEDLPGDVALEATDDLALREPFLGATLDIGTSLFAVPQPDDDGEVKRSVGASITSSMETMALGLTAGSGDGCDAAESSKGSFRAHSGWVVSRRDQELGGVIGADCQELRDEPAVA